MRRQTRARIAMILCVNALTVASFGLTLGFSSTPVLRAGRRALGIRRSAPLPSTQHARPRCGLTMHLGHSHGHDMHQHINGVEVNGEKRGNVPFHKKRRRAALFLFAALAILGPPLWRNRAIGRADAAAFVVSSLALSMFDSVRREVKHAVNKMKDFRNSIAKHSTPLNSKFFFKNDNAADRVTLLGGVVNLVLSSAKFVVGVTCHSSSLVADAGHSLSDLFSDFITLWAVQIGRLPPDDDHPYGHGKFEAVGSLFLALTLLGTGISVGVISNKKLIEIISIQRKSGVAAASALVGKVPSAPALLMAGLSILSKEWLYRITHRVGQDINSQVVIANAWHHRSDAYSSVLALISIGLAMFVPGLLAADSAAGILVAGMICMTGAEIMGESIKQLTDTSNEELVEKVTALAAERDDVLDVKRVRARQVGSSAIVDVSIGIPDDLSSSAARAIEERLRVRIMEEPGVIDADVHGTGEGVVFPLLVATEDITDQPSAAEVENDVRKQILSNPDVNSVQGITVHYESTLLINVDVDIRLDPDVTVAKANTLAAQLRQTLESLSNINKANIFLDLNEGAIVMPSN